MGKLYTPEERIKVFWSKVNKIEGENSCWEWQGCILNSGYGQFGIGNHKTMLAHRFSYSISVGEIPEGLEVCHTCDNPCCVKPSHLFVGTHQQNMDDSLRKDRIYNRGKGPKREHQYKDKWEF